MGHHRAQAQFDRARWRLGALVPIWVFQGLLAAGLAGLFGWRLSETLENWDDEERKGTVPKVRLVWECTNIGLAGLSFVLTSYEIFRYYRETLTPWTLLFSHALKLTCSLGVLALDIVVFIKQRDGHYSLISLILDGTFIAVSVFSAIYAIRSYRRLSAYDELMHPMNAKPYGFNPEPETAYPSRLSVITQNHRNPAHSSSPLSSRSERRRSSASTSSALSRGGDPLSSSTMSPSVYNHERDTLFDEYSSRQKAAQLRDHVERALRGPGGPDWAGSPGGGRMSSYERRTLGAVQEVAEEEEEGVREMKGGVESDRVALLGKQGAVSRAEAAGYSNGQGMGDVELEDLRRGPGGQEMGANHPLVVRA